MREYRYDSSLDIYSFFHNREVIGNFIEFMFEKAIEFSEMIEKNGNEKPYPINYEARGFQFQIDYNYFIYIVGQWVAKLSNEEAKILKVVHDYAIYSESLANKINDRNRKGFSLFLSEVLEIVTTRDKKSNGKFATKVNDYKHQNEKVIEFNGDYFDMKIVGIVVKKLHFYSDTFEDKDYINHKYFSGKGVKQIAFYSAQVEHFWEGLAAKNGGKKNIYFMVDKEDFLNSSYFLLEKNSFD